MGRLSKAEEKEHESALEILWGSDNPLTHDQILYVFEHWLPYSSEHVAGEGAFFTPWEIALHVALCSGDRGRFVDICAGIGALSYAIACQDFGRPDWHNRNVVAVEKNPEYLKVGQRILPEVEWINGDVYDKEMWLNLGKFDFAISNPPFGKVAGNKGRNNEWLKYNGTCDLEIVEIGLRVSETGITAVVPQTSVPNIWRRSNGATRWKDAQVWEEPANPAIADWRKRVGILDRPDYGLTGEVGKFFDANKGVEIGGMALDLGEYAKLWRGAAPVVEVVSYEFYGDMLLKYDG